MSRLILCDSGPPADIRVGLLLNRKDQGLRLGRRALPDLIRQWRFRPHAVVVAELQKRHNSNFGQRACEAALTQAVPGEPLAWTPGQDPFRRGTRQSSLARSALLSWAVLSLRVQEGQSCSSGNGFACAIGGTMPR